MAEPTLSLTLDELRREVARFLSFGRDYTNLTITQQEDVDSIIRRGLRQFYFPPPSMAGMSHQWSFLRPTASLTLVANVASYQLPEDFGGIVGTHLTYQAYSDVRGPSLVGEHAFRTAVEANPVQSGRPAIATIRPRVASGDLSQPTRFDIVFWPTPSKSEALLYEYSVIQDAVTGSLSHPAGAAIHGETIIASCLAIAEEYVVSPTTKYRELFRERLASSISMDKSTRGGWRIGNMGTRNEAGETSRPRVSLVQYQGYPPA